MRRYPILTWILLLELFFLALLVAAISIKRVILLIFEPIQARRRAHLSKLFVQAVATNEFVPTETWKWRNLLSVVEEFDRRFSGGDWVNIKNKVAEPMLLRARRWARSLFWKKRNRAARIFASFPRKEDEEMIVALIGDRQFLVSSIAALAMIRLDSEAGLLQMMERMASEFGYQRDFFCDLFLQGSKKILTAVIGFATERKALRKVCFEILANESTALPVPFFAEELVSEDFEMRRLAFQALLRNPLHGELLFFQKALSDPAPEIRRLAAKGLVNFSSEETLALLEKALGDIDWQVRIDAACSLKQMGAIEILERQTEKTGAKTAAQYVLII